MKVYALCDAVDDKRLEGLEGQIKSNLARARARAQQPLPHAQIVRDG